VAIDVPFGLSDNGERPAASRARGRRPGRSSTSFNSPPRACLEATDDDYDGANELSRRHGAKGLSRQSLGLLAKIREVDGFRASAPCPVFEVHPELSFPRMNGGVALAPKKSWSGVIARRELLLARDIDLDGFRNQSADRATADDVLDAEVRVDREPDSARRSAVYSRSAAIRGNGKGDGHSRVIGA
jgi:predicted RNase H-like nuclease